MSQSPTDSSGHGAKMSAEEMVRLCKQHSVYTWSAGDAVNPLPIERAEGVRLYDTDGNEGVFTQSELDVIAEVWKRVAEDFAPYDIDVTTEEPTSFGPNVGHILVTRKADTGRSANENECALIPIMARSKEAPRRGRIH